MKKVININFQGQVIPIEESAYEMLQQYITSLRQYFANEEGRDEIINDIENRIAELFTDMLKKGAACVTDTEVNKVMDSMGRPQDFADADNDASGASFTNGSAGEQAKASTSGAGNQQSENNKEHKRLYRNEEDKLLGGVASGIANYLNLDPALIRIAFALLTILGGSGLLVYIILWIVLPSRSLYTNIRKRLYRDPSDKIIGGVCGGLANYFDINPSIPRLIFAAPFILGVVTSIGRNLFNSGFVFIGGSGGFTFILAYVILWIILPEAHSAAEKLEMRGEKVDLNSIRNTVMGDLQGVKGRLQQAGAEFGEQAQKFGTEFSETVSERTTAFANDVRQGSRRGSWLGKAIAIFFKAIIYILGGAIAIGLFVGLIALMGSGIGLMPLRNFVLEGSWQNIFAWGSILLFIGVPVVATLIWIIRRMMGVKNGNKFMGYAFTLLWVVGIFCIIGFFASLNRSFSSQVGKQEDVNMTQPSNNFLKVQLKGSNYMYSDSWFDFDGVVSINNDSLNMNTIKLSVVKSKDSLYHLHFIKISKGYDRNKAQSLAENIHFFTTQTDSILALPESFSVSKTDKWRNQRIIVVIEVPVGKYIEVDDDVRSQYDYFNVELGRRRDWRVDWNRNWEDAEFWTSNRKMLMKDDGLEWYKDSKEIEADRMLQEREDRKAAEAKLDSLKAVIDSIQKQLPVQKDSVINTKVIQSEKDANYMPNSPISAMIRFF